MVLLSNTNIIIDGFSYTAQLEQPHYIFFLTHFHSDHYQGLSPSWNRGPIYCSPQTALLLRDKFSGIPNIYPLEIGETYWIPLNLKTCSGLNVTFIDANHCPGAVMILFQGEIGTILHTGDFRYTPRMLLEPCLNTSANSLITINQIILDNTFCMPEYDFPSQEICTKLIIQIIEENPNYDVWIAIENFGRETLLVDLSLYFNTLIIVSESMFRRIEILGLRPDLFSTNSDDGWIHAVPRKHMFRIYQRNREGLDTIGIYLSGWYRKYSKEWPFYNVPYSLHSSFSEIKEFVKKIKPERLSYIVPPGNSLKGVFELSGQVLEDVAKDDKTLESLENKMPVKRQIGTGSGGFLKKMKKPKIIGSKIAESEEIDEHPEINKYTMHYYI